MHFHSHTRCKLNGQVCRRHRGAISQTVVPRTCSSRAVRSDAYGTPGGRHGGPGATRPLGWRSHLHSCRRSNVKITRPATADRCHRGAPTSTPPMVSYLLTNCSANESKREMAEGWGDELNTSVAKRCSHYYVSTTDQWRKQALDTKTRWCRLLTALEDNSVKLLCSFFIVNWVWLSEFLYGCLGHKQDAFIKAALRLMLYMFSLPIWIACPLVFFGNVSTISKPVKAMRS